MNFKFPFTSIKKAYLEVFDDSNTNKQKRLSARNVIDTIVNGAFFEKKDVIDLYNGVNNNLTAREIKRKGKTPYKPYGVSFKERLSFLCDYRLINSDLKSEYLFIYGDAGLHSKAHDRFKEGEEKLIQVIKIYLNEILDSFLDKFEESKGFLVPIKMISEQDIKFYNQITNRIETFWNIKFGKPWYIKYRTIFSFFFIVFFAFLFPIVALVIISIGIYSTKKFVLDLKVKKLRNAIHYISVLLVLLNIGFSFYELSNSYEYKSGNFDSNSHEKLGKSLGIYLSKDTIPLKELDLSYLKKDSSKIIVIEHKYRNNGDDIIPSPMASMNIIRNHYNILFEGKLFSGIKTTPISLIDSVMIRIYQPYHIEFVDGVIANPFNTYYKGYGYNKSLQEIYSKNNSLGKGVLFSLAP